MPNPDDTNPNRSFTTGDPPRPISRRTWLIIYGGIFTVMIVSAVIWWFFGEMSRAIQTHSADLISFVCFAFIAGACDFIKNRQQPHFVYHLILHFAQWLSLAAAAIILATYIQL